MHILCSFLTTIVLLLSRTVPVHGDFKVLTGTLEATSSSIRYVSDFLIAPGSVDLTNVIFSTDISSSISLKNDGNKDGETDNYFVADNNDNENYVLSDDDNGDDNKENKRNMETERSTSAKKVLANLINNTTTGNELETSETILNIADGGNRTRRHLSPKEFTIDILLFHEPSACAKLKQGCDWTKLGIGNSDEAENIRWCCSTHVVELGLCEPEQVGKLIVDKEKFNGKHKQLSVSSEGEFNGTVPLSVMSSYAGSGKYTLLMSNCDDNGRDVELSGASIWKSHRGYLPGGLFEKWNFITVLSLCYAGLLIWYGMSMKLNRDSTIEIQKWILCTIFLSLNHIALESFDYEIWNITGTRSNSALYSWIIIGIIKEAIARCLLIMVCLGWGVTRETLGDQMNKIHFLGIVYLITAFLRDVAGIVFVEDTHLISDEVEGEEIVLYNIFVTFFTLVTATIDIVCYIWILNALNGTMQYLENMNQTIKLKKYLRLRLILLSSVLFGLFWIMLGIINSLTERAFLPENHDWVVLAAWSVNFFFVLTSIALLWRPNPRAKEFANIMEISTVGEDIDLVDTNVDPIGLDDNDIYQSYSKGWFNTTSKVLLFASLSIFCGVLVVPRYFSPQLSIVGPKKEGLFFSKIATQDECLSTFPENSFDMWEEGECNVNMTDIRVDLSEDVHHVIKDPYFEFSIRHQHNFTLGTPTCAASIFTIFNGASAIVAGKVHIVDSYTLKSSVYLSEPGNYILDVYYELDEVKIATFNVTVKKDNSLKRFDSSSICQGNGAYAGRWIRTEEEASPIYPPDDISAHFPPEYPDKIWSPGQREMYDWQPYCCSYKKYNHLSDVLTCLDDKWIDFSGDSMTRFMFVDALQAIGIDRRRTKDLKYGRASFWSDDERILLTFNFQSYLGGDHFGDFQVYQQMTEDFPERWKHRVPNVWILNSGLWSLKEGDSVEEYQKKIDKAVEIIQNKKHELGDDMPQLLVRSSTTSRRSGWKDTNRLLGFNQVIRNMAHTLDAVYMDSYSLTIPRFPDSIEDNLHFIGKPGTKSMTNIAFNMICNTTL